MDVIGWFVANLHHLLGHDKAAAVIGAPAGDKRFCLLCQHEQNPDDLTRQSVLRALTPGESGELP